MATHSILSSVLLIFLMAFTTPTLSEKSAYIVHMSHSHKPAAFASHHEWYSSILHSLSSTSNISTSLIYSYSRAATGFAAHISAAHAAKLRRLPSVLSVVPDKIVKLHTTRSPEFLGLAQESGIWDVTNSYSSDVIIGVIDSGIWPESPSFNDQGLDAKPERWQGSCDGGEDFSCNNKVIGAGMFYQGYERLPNVSLTYTKTARDMIGHGSHCASVAAGSRVESANYEGYALGTASGVAPNARIAAYKAFWGNPPIASSIDVLKAMDKAVSDGVDVISLSLGGIEDSYDQDWQAVGAFRAMQNNVLVSTTAANGGPGNFTVENVSPWMLTVAASTMDREFPATVVLGNGRTAKGASLSKYRVGRSTPSVDLITGQEGGSRFCVRGDLIKRLVAGKIVICDTNLTLLTPVKQSYAVKEAGGLGMIVVTDERVVGDLDAEPFIIPATSVTKTAGKEIKIYHRNTWNPRVSIVFNGTIISGSPPSPRLASFSSRGPNRLTPEILKPDVTAPGVNILAAWTKKLGPSSLIVDQRRVDFKVMSGTSMACPHVSGLAALLKKARPTWSPSAIKSAIMTTSYNVDNAGNNFRDLAGRPSTPFVHGSGHIDPKRALDPGLVYDLATADYVAFLCSIGYNSTRIAVFFDGPSNTINPCAANSLSRPGDLNYPSFAIAFNSANDVVTYTRSVTNVGETDAVYKVQVTDPEFVQVSVEPTKLEFNADQQTLHYTVTFTSTITSSIPSPELIVGSGSIVWSDETNQHHVRSPIAVYWPIRTPTDEEEDLVASF